MIAAQERLDWECYRLYGLVNERPQTAVSPNRRCAWGAGIRDRRLPGEWRLGEEESIVVRASGSTPITELPTHWSAAYTGTRRAANRANRDRPEHRTIERPEYKRRWDGDSWDNTVDTALRSWLLDRLEGRRYWPEPASNHHRRSPVLLRPNGRRVRIGRPAVRRPRRRRPGRLDRRAGEW